MKKITRLAFTTLLAVGAITTGFSQVNQQDLGAKCGCPNVSARSTVSITSQFSTTTARGITEVTQNVHLTCDKIWQIGGAGLPEGKLYIPKPYSITIDPGTLIQGVYTPNQDSAACLIIERGAQIFANGNADCNIVFTTSLDNLDGTHSISNCKEWGGINLMGIATDNLVDTANNIANFGGVAAFPNGGYPLGFGVTGEGHGEGFALTANVGNVFGANAADAAFPTPNDADNSGVMTYVSIRHGGALVGGLGLGNEINGLTFDAVGSGTTINHIEMISSGDDCYEYFGGAVNVKYMSDYFSDDDKMDYDIGYHGKAQFLFSIAADSLNTGDLQSTDNGVEGDADDQFGMTWPQFPFSSNPQIYNATFIHNGRVHARLDNTGPAGIQNKEGNTGQIYNSIFVNYRSGCHFSEVRDSAGTIAAGQPWGGDGYDNWANSSHASPRAHHLPSVNPNDGQNWPDPGTLIIKNNIFVVPNDGQHYCFTRGALVKNNKYYGAGNGKYVKDFSGSAGSDVSIYTLTTNTQQSISIGKPTSADSVQFLTTDQNTCLLSPGIASANSVIPGIQTNWSWTNTNYNSFSKPFHAVPLNSSGNIALLNSSTPPPADGFFTVVNYKGAFDPAGQESTWLSNWGSSAIAMQSMIASNPTDINQDGVTDINDFLLLVGKFGQQDQ